MHALKRVFSIDLRSIALFRVCLASLILLDLILRSGDIVAFYTDDGVLPLRHWSAVTHDLRVSLHAASGELWWQLLLFLLAALFALGLLIGYRSRLMAAGSFVLLASLLNRNVLILQAGDLLLVIMCFWSLFLPLGARWSIDAALQPELQRAPNARRYDPGRPQTVFSVATVAVIIQVLCLYFFTALLKTGAAWRVRFDAAFYALSLQQFVTPLGAWLRQFTGVLQLATVYVLVVEFLAPILVLLPTHRANADAAERAGGFKARLLAALSWVFRWPRSRLIGLALLASLHVAFLLLLHIGLFPLIDFMSLTLLLPSAVWIWLAERRRNLRREAIVLYYDEDCGFCLKMCLILREFLLPPSVAIYRAQSRPHIGDILERENSWVVTDADGKVYLHWEAMQFLFTQAWPFKPIGWLMRLPPLMWLGHRLYRSIARNRGAMGRFTHWALPFRALNIRPSWPNQLLAAVFFYVIIVYNISGLADMSHWRNGVVNTLAHVTRTDQRWGMFAPFPLTVSFYPLIPGTLRNGETIDLYSLTSSAEDWHAPAYMYPLYESYRWRKFFTRVNSHSNNAVRRSFGDYLCRSWNTPDRARDEQLGILEINFVKLRTNTDGLPKAEERNRVWRHWCYPEFAPS